MKTSYVSSFSDIHLPIYGEKFLKSFKLVKDDLHFYAENFATETSIDFHTTIPHHREFYDYIKNLQAQETNKKQIRRLDKGLRWSYKSYVIIHALENIDTDYLIWIDGDVQVLKTPPEDLCQQLCGDRLMFGFEERVAGMKHIESGFVIFNKNHKNINLILDGYKEGYYNKGVLELPKPWDSFWLAHLTERKGIKEHCVLKKSPFSNIREWFHHDVGKEKFNNTNVNKYLGR